MCGQQCAVSEWIGGGSQALCIFSPLSSVLSLPVVACVIMGLVLKWAVWSRIRTRAELHHLMHPMISIKDLQHNIILAMYIIGNNDSIIMQIILY